MLNKHKIINLINLVTEKKYFNKKIDTISKKLIKKSFQSIKIGKVAFYKQLEMSLEKLMTILL